MFSFTAVLTTFALLLLATTISTGKSRFEGIEWQNANRSVCDEMHCENVSTCSVESGVKLDFLSRAAKANPDSACTYIAGDTSRLYKAEDLVQHLGSSAVLAFTGDSVARSIFASYVDMLGGPYKEWLSDLHELAANWTGAKRERIDHTYMCSPPLGATNLTLAFLWRPMLGMTVNRVPWVLASMPGKLGKCVWWENGAGMRHCDGSTIHGSDARWRCSIDLDSVQMTNRPKRKFVVVATGGVHNAVDAVKGVAPHTNETVYLQHSYGHFQKIFESMEETKQHWDVVTKEGGRHLLISPFEVTYGLPRTTSGNHHTATMMNRMLDVHVRQRLRKRSNLTCPPDGLEVIDASSLFLQPKSPGSVGDGIHYEHITNVAVMQLIMHRLISYNSSNWRNDCASWNSSSAESCGV